MSRVPMPKSRETYSYPINSYRSTKSTVNIIFSLKILQYFWIQSSDVVLEFINHKIRSKIQYLFIKYKQTRMSFLLPQLPFHKDAFGKVISAETFQYHYGKHHQTYVSNLNSLIKGTQWEHRSLDQIVNSAKDPKIFNNAAQHWNHIFYWHSISPEKSEPEGKLREQIIKKWGSVDGFLKDFNTSAADNFGSGWTWLVKKGDEVSIMNTSNAHNPMTGNFTPLLTVDVWQHAYYIDYRNARIAYLQNFNSIINWKFATQNYDSGKVNLKF